MLSRFNGLHDWLDVERKLKDDNGSQSSCLAFGGVKGLWIKNEDRCERKECVFWFRNRSVGGEVERGPNEKKLLTFPIRFTKTSFQLFPYQEWPPWLTNKVKFANDTKVFTKLKCEPVLHQCWEVFGGVLFTWFLVPVRWCIHITLMLEVTP